MNKGIGPPLFIECRTTDTIKSNTLIKLKRARILLVHIRGQVRMGRDRVLYQSFANALSMPIRINEKRFEMAVM